MEEGSSSVAPEPEAAGVAGVFPLSELLRLGEESSKGCIDAVLTATPELEGWSAVGESVEMLGGSTARRQDGLTCQSRLLEAHDTTLTMQVALATAEGVVCGRGEIRFALLHGGE